MRNRGRLLGVLSASGLSACKFTDDLRDWTWETSPLWEWFRDTVVFHIERLGPIGYFYVPAAIILVLMMWRPTRQFVTLVLVDIYRHTLSHVFSKTVEVLAWVLLYLWGQIVARFRGAAGWLSNRIK